MTRDNGALAIDRAADDGSWRIAAYEQDTVPTFVQAWIDRGMDFEQRESPFTQRARLRLLPGKVLA